MSLNKFIEYIKKTPANTNPAVVNSMLEGEMNSTLAAAKQYSDSKGGYVIPGQYIKVQVDKTKIITLGDLPVIKISDQALTLHDNIDVKLGIHEIIKDDAYISVETFGLLFVREQEDEEGCYTELKISDTPGNTKDGIPLIMTYKAFIPETKNLEGTYVICITAGILQEMGEIVLELPHDEPVVWVDEIKWSDTVIPFESKYTPRELGRIETRTIKQEVNANDFLLGAKLITKDIIDVFEISDFKVYMTVDGVTESMNLSVEVVSDETMVMGYTSLCSIIPITESIFQESNGLSELGINSPGTCLLFNKTLPDELLSVDSVEFMLTYNYIHQISEKLLLNSLANFTVLLPYNFWSPVVYDGQTQSIDQESLKNPIRAMVSKSPIILRFADENNRIKASVIANFDTDLLVPFSNYGGWSGWVFQIQNVWYKFYLDSTIGKWYFMRINESV